MRTQSKIFDEAVYKALKGTEPDVAISTTNIEIGAKGGGGLSDLNETLMIKGQPHNLAWINRDEASVLKAMGGSGKKVGGIPAYFDEWSMGGPEAEQQMADVFENIEGAETPGKPMEYEYKSPEYQQLISKEAQAALPSATTYYEEETTGPARYLATEKIPNFLEDGIPDKLVPYWNALKDRGMSNQAAADYLAGMGTAGLASMEGAYDTGYSFGGPMGTMGGLTRDMAVSYAKKLKLKDLEDEIEKLDDKLSSEERTAQIKDIFSRYNIPDLGTLTARTDLKGLGSDIEATAIKQGISPTIAKALSWAAPGKTWTELIAGAGNALSSLFGVRGEFETKDGKTFRVMRGGELVEPAMPSVPDEGTVETVEAVVAPTSETVAEVEAGPMETFQAGLESIESNEGIENSIQILMNNLGVSESEARAMLGLDVNIA